MSFTVSFIWILRAFSFRTLAMLFPATLVASVALTSLAAFLISDGLMTVVAFISLAAFPRSALRFPNRPATLLASM